MTTAKQLLLAATAVFLTTGVADSRDRFERGPSVPVLPMRSASGKSTRAQACKTESALSPSIRQLYKSPLQPILPLPARRVVRSHRHLSAASQRRKRQRELFNIQRAELAYAFFDLGHCFFFGNDPDVHGECKREQPHAQYLRQQHQFQ